MRRMKYVRALSLRFARVKVDRISQLFLTLHLEFSSSGPWTCIGVKSGVVAICSTHITTER